MRLLARPLDAVFLLISSGSIRPAPRDSIPSRAGEPRQCPFEDGPRLTPHGPDDGLRPGPKVQHADATAAMSKCRIPFLLSGPVRQLCAQLENRRGLKTLILPRTSQKRLRAARPISHPLFCCTSATVSGEHAWPC